MFTATYDPADNKLRLRSDERLPPDLYARVRAAGFIWAPKQDLFVAPAWTPEREDLLFELAGEVGDEDTSLVDRAANRAERFAGYEEKRGAEAEQARAAVERITDGIPLGQPILVGHHSQRHAERDAKKIENGMRRAIKLWETAEYWKRRAAGAFHHAKYKELPAVRARRIKGLEADERKHAKGKAHAEKFVKAWARIDDPTFLKKKDGSEPTTLERALFVATCDSRLVSILDIRNGKLSVETAQAQALAAHTEALAHHDRWLAHTRNRLVYERAMLAESGYVPPAKKLGKGALPILNYSGTVSYRDAYSFRGHEVKTEEATPITKAELAAINTDFKGTWISSCGTHRVRFVMIRKPGELYAVGRVVYLADSKQHMRPSAAAVIEGEAQVEAARFAEAARGVDTRRERQIASEARRVKTTSVDAMRAALAAGVQVVVNPYLFPTPPALADRAVALAQVEDWHVVLEPSAGTGRIVEAIKRAAPRAHVDMVEVNAECCKVLARKFQLTASEIAPYDFLEVSGPICPDSESGFDRIVMNPPFDHGLDVKHILHALTFLKPGGMLVAICADGPQQERELKPLSATWEKLPAGTFADQGTCVRTILLSIHKV